MSLSDAGTYLGAIAHRRELEEMADRLEKLAPDHGAAEATRWLADIAADEELLPMALRNVWDAVESGADDQHLALVLGLARKALRKPANCFACYARLNTRLVGLSRAAVLDLVHMYDQLHYHGRKYVEIDEVHDLVVVPKDPTKKRAATYQAMQTLQYWDLAQPYVPAHGARTRGRWSIRPDGEAFVEDRLDKYESVRVFRNRVKRYEGVKINIYEVPWLEITAPGVASTFQAHFPHLREDDDGNPPEGPEHDDPPED